MSNLFSEFVGTAVLVGLALSIMIAFQKNQ
jgi:glycerol uptake facilitator-like aquaporin